MITKIGSQNREPLAESGMAIVSDPKFKLSEGEIVLEDLHNHNLELWIENDHFAGYVIEINGKGYEFVRTIS